MDTPRESKDIHAHSRVDDRDVVLVVDMDGTLVRTDTLHEALLSIASTKPLELIKSIPYLKKNKFAFKQFIAEQSLLSPEILPYNDDVLTLIRQARSAGRKVALVSASDHRQVSLVAEYLGLFDFAVGSGSPSQEGVNVSGTAKANLLVEMFGSNGFDYIGDCSTDIPVWKASRKALVVNPTKKLLEHTTDQGIVLDVVSKKDTSELRNLVMALRPHQWSKNLLILVPVFAAHQFDAIATALAAMLAFSLVASCVYILNDLIDLTSDRLHPRKKSRPFASGAVSAKSGILVATGLFFTAVVISLLVTPSSFIAVLVAYFALTFAYSFLLKRKLLVDIITLAGLYTIRIFAGSAATGIMLSPWLMVFSMFIFFSLAAIKRQAELVDLEKRGESTSVGRGYSVEDLPVVQNMAVSTGQAAVLVFALYVYSSGTEFLYAIPELIWLICVVLFYWLNRLFVMTHRGFMDDDPIVFAVKDRNSRYCLMAIVIIALVATFGGW